MPTAPMSPSSLLKVACVTGGAKRIGKHIVLALHAANYQVIIHCHHSFEHAKQLAEQLNAKRSNSCHCVQGDLQETCNIPLLASAIIACYGQLDVLVHNASRFYPTPLGTVTPIDWHNLMASNAQAPLLLTQALARYLAKEHGTVVSILDIHANGRPFVGYSVYNMAKAAHQMLVQSLALEFAPCVRVNGVAPGVNILPEQHTEQAIDPVAMQRICQSIPMGRIGTPQDIAETVLFLVNATYITGQIIAVDGGRSLTLG